MPAQTNVNIDNLIKNTVALKTQAWHSLLTKLTLQIIYTVCTFYRAMLAQSAVMRQ